ncbi:MAG: penicillin-binding protein 2 [Bacteroidales bacterium]|nr:penicillin-binding protein 2 [Bacteroidales bacterium]
MIIRFATIFTVIALGFVCVLIKIVAIQTFEREQWMKIAEQQEKANLIIQPRRGNILDANGNLLASSLPQYYIYMDTRVEALHLKGGKLFYEYVDSIADGLSRIIGDNSAAAYRQRMVEAYRGKRYKECCIKLSDKRINFIQKKQIEQLPLIKRGLYKSGVYFEAQNRRAKPYGSLASRTIGNLYGQEQKGYSGLEMQFDNYLRGKEGVSTRQRVAGRWQNVPVREAENGCDIVTTLDANLLDICETALRARLDKTQADWGCCILMETHSGEIKAICNLDRTEDGNYYESANHAVTRVEPGSTFKTIALMAAMDDGKIDIDDTVSVTRKPWMYNGLKHTDAHPNDTVYTVRSALAISSNIALAKIITESYEKKATKFVKKLTEMGITDSVYIEIPGATNPLIRVPKDAGTLSKMSYGYSVELSPIQIIMFYNGIANDGKMIRPFLVKEIRKNGRTIEQFETSVVKSALCKHSTLEDIKLALHDVVWDDSLAGTASVIKGTRIRKAQSQLVHIAGKTGTAQISENGRYYNNRHRMTFVGYFPEEDPQYTCLCMIQHPRNAGGYDAGLDCGIVVRQIAEKTIATTGFTIYKRGQKHFVKR